MKERKAIIGKFIAKGMKAEKASMMAGMSKSSYYYRPRGGKPGRPSSTHCLKDNVLLVSNEEVVEDIRTFLSGEFMENGYLKVCHELKDMGYEIGKNKTYRLMKENRLLLPPPQKAKREYVQYTQPLPSEPFEKIEMDIKFIYIRGQHKNALLLTFLDTFTRLPLGWELQYSIRHQTVAALFDRVIENWLQPYHPCFEEKVKVCLRNDNDSRFVAKDLQNYLKSNFVDQEFILPATPQQNAHIESFHSVVEELVCKKYEFEDIHQVREILDRFFYTYTFRRTINSILYLPPAVFFHEWLEGNIGVSNKKKGNRTKQTFFFIGQRPKWLSVPIEEFYNRLNDKVTKKDDIFVEPSLIES